MDFKVRINSNICELTISSGNATIMEDMATENMKVPQVDINTLVRTALELNKFNGQSDFDFFTDIIDTFGTETEKQLVANYYSAE